MFYGKKHKEWKLAQSLRDESECEASGVDLMGEYANEEGEPLRIENEEDWSEPEDWSTEALLHWCKVRNIDTADKFCKEDLVSLVNEAGADSDSDDERYEREYNRPRGFQIASRVKTDGTYRRPASMNPNFSLFGNRINLGVRCVVAYYNC